MRQLRAPLLGLVALASCAAPFPHRWANGHFGYEIASGLPKQSVHLMLEKSVDERLRAFCPIFAVEDLTGLKVFVHDALAPEYGAGRIRGVHRRGEIHVFARFRDGRLKMPAPHAQATIAHEMVHALAMRAGLDLPRWMEEGLAEVLASSGVDGEGRVTLWFHTKHEGVARALSGTPAWLPADQLFAIRDAYPDAKHMRALYAQSSSFVAHLLRVGEGSGIEASEVRERIQRMRTRSADELTREFIAWKTKLTRHGFLQRLDKFAASGDSRIKQLVCTSIGSLPSADAEGAEAWWSLLARLLCDDDEAVRKAARIRLSLPRSEDKKRYLAWRRSSDRRLRLIALVDLALLGDRNAAIEMLSSMRGPEDLEWWQPLVWLTMKWNPKAMPELNAIVLRPEKFAAWCRASIATIRAAK